MNQLPPRTPLAATPHSTKPTSLGRRWWGEFAVPEGETRRWQIGELSLLISNLEREWRVARQQQNETSDTHVAICEPASLSEIEKYEQQDRFGYSRVTEHIRLTPRLADRPVITQPRAPFHIPAQEEVTVFVTTLLWMLIELQNPSKKLIEFPIIRPSDTWFGPDTGLGELCYASRTYCFLHLHELTLKPHRAITATRIVNRSQEPLLLERIQLHVPNLALYETNDGVLWTQDIALECTEGTGFAALTLVDAKPKHAPGNVTLLSPARTRANHEGMIRAFSSFLNLRRG